jgi:hypothetical protein
MKCTDVQKELIDYLCQTIQPATEIKINQHIAECKKCSQSLENYRGILDKIKSTPLIIPAQQIQKKIWDTLKPDNVSTLKKFFFYPIKLYQTAAAIILLAAAFLVYVKISTPPKEITPIHKLAPLVPRITAKDSAPFFVPAPSTFDISLK